MNARPFILNVPPKGNDPADPTLPPGSKPPPGQERGVPGGGNETREGLLEPVAPVKAADRAAAVPSPRPQVAAL